MSLSPLMIPPSIPLLTPMLRPRVFWLLSPLFYWNCSCRGPWKAPVDLSLWASLGPCFSTWLTSLAPWCRCLSPSPTSLCLGLHPLVLGCLTHSCMLVLPRISFLALLSSYFRDSLLCHFIHFQFQPLSLVANLYYQLEPFSQTLFRLPSFRCTNTCQELYVCRDLLQISFENEWSMVSGTLMSIFCWTSLLGWRTHILRLLLTQTGFHACT